ncbi:MAG TPA: hypothetical protein VIL71_19395, partial [Spirillospora sp.]
HHEADGLDRRTAERLIGGADDHARLHALLSAAAGPALPEELAGEEAAVAAFRAARHTARRSRMAALRRFLTVKALVLIGGSLVLSGGAAAYAAMNGHLPGYERSPSPRPSPTLDDQTGGDRHDHRPATRLSTPSASLTAGPPSTKPPASSGPSSQTTSKKGGRQNAPGQQEHGVSENPDQPPRGPGDNNGSPPGENSGNGKGNKGNNGNNGSPPGQNSGKGEDDKDDEDDD